MPRRSEQQDGKSWQEIKRGKPAWKKKNIIGANIKKFRQLKGLNQGQLAFLAYHSGRSYISSIENGHFLPSFYLLLEIADVLGVPPAYFFLDSEKDNFFHIYHVLSGVAKRQIRRYAMRLVGMSEIDLSHSEIEVDESDPDLKSALDAKRRIQLDKTTMRVYNLFRPKTEQEAR